MKYIDYLQIWKLIGLFTKYRPGEQILAIEEKYITARTVLVLYNI